MNTLGMLVAPVNVIPIKNSLIERNQTTVIIPEATDVRVFSGSARTTVGNAVMGISFGYECPPDACCPTFVVRRRINRYGPHVRNSHTEGNR
jgi:hypothetical protein